MVRLHWCALPVLAFATSCLDSPNQQCDAQSLLQSKSAVRLAKEKQQPDGPPRASSGTAVQRGRRIENERLAESMCEEHRTTPGTCRWLGCYSWRGETECIDGRCVCANGGLSGNTPMCDRGDGVCTTPILFWHAHDYDCDMCRQQAEELGLEIGSPGYPFESDNYDYGGCYAYRTGEFGCSAFCGKGTNRMAEWAIEDPNVVRIARGDIGMDPHEGVIVGSQHITGENDPDGLIGFTSPIDHCSVRTGHHAYDCEICRQHAETLGLELGTADRPFVSDYNPNTLPSESNYDPNAEFGCFAYKGGEYGCHAFCGGGSVAMANAPIRGSNANLVRIDPFTGPSATPCIPGVGLPQGGNY